LSITDSAERREYPVELASRTGAGRPGIVAPAREAYED